MIVAQALSIVAHGLLSFSCVHPMVGMSILGVSYSVAGSVLWPSVALLVRVEAMGSARSLMTLIQVAGDAVSSQVTGIIATRYDYKEALLYMGGNMILGLVAAILIRVLDRRRGKKLNKRTR